MFCLLPSSYDLQLIAYFILPPSSFIPGLRCSPELFTPKVRGRNLHLADLLDVSGQAEKLQRSDSPPADVDLVPHQSVSRCSRMRMVIVVPAFTETKKCNPPIIGRVISGNKAPSAPDVRCGVDQPCPVQTECHA